MAKTPRLLASDTILVTSPASAQNVFLPTSGIKAGKTVAVVCSGATTTNYVTVKSSDGVATIMEFYGDGHVSLVALQDTPTAASHWKALDSQDLVTLNLTPSTLTDNSALSCRLRRSGRNVELAVGIGGWLRTKDGTSSPISLTIIPSFCRIPYTSMQPVSCVSNGSWVTGTASISTDGTIGLYAGPYVTTFAANSANNGMGSGAALLLSWYI